MEWTHQQTADANIWHFHKPQRAVSWALSGGGIREGVHTVANVSLAQDQRSLPPDALIRLGTSLIPEATDPILMFTAVPAEAITVGSAKENGLRVVTYVTAGLGNRRAFADPWEHDETAAGTINIVAAVNYGLTENALLEFMALLSAMKTSVLGQYEFRSPLSGKPSAGTGTDCIVVCAPMQSAVTLKFAGLHTLLRSVAWRALNTPLSEAIARSAREMRKNPACLLH